MLRCPHCRKWLWGKNWGNHWILGECSKEAYEKNREMYEEERKSSRKKKKSKPV